jgi:4-hydroxybenzoate polyprenyltransferase
LALLLLGWAGYLARRHAFYFCFLGFAGLAFGRQAYGLAREDPERLAFSYFKSHGYIGSFILLGIAGDYLLNGA